MRDIKAIEEDLNVLLKDLAVVGPNHPDFKDILDGVVGLRQELEDTRARIQDLNSAKYLLNRHGYAFKIWTPEDVERRVASIADAENRTGIEVAKIVAHVVEGDDWSTMGEESTDDDANLWAIIEGTRGDHPEWFGEER